MRQWFLDNGLLQDFGILDMNGIRAVDRAVKIPPPSILGGPSVLVPRPTGGCEDEAPERPHVLSGVQWSFCDFASARGSSDSQARIQTPTWYRHSDQHVNGVGTSTGIDVRPTFIINNHGNRDTVQEGVVICTPWSYPATRHAPTAINISNQSPCCLSTYEPNFRWTREMQNWALTQAPGTPEARPQRPKRSRGAQGQPNPDTQKQMLLILSRLLALKHDLEIRELQAATFRTMLAKYDERLVKASKAPTGLFVPNRRRDSGQRASRTFTDRRP